MMGTLLVAALAVLWVVFVVSATSKLASVPRQRAFARSLRDLRLLPGSLVVPVAAVVSCVELAIAVGLAAALVGLMTGAWWAIPVAGAAVVVAVGLLAVLTTGIVVALRRRSTAPCACFGASDRPLSWRHVLRNGLMLLIGVAGLAVAIVVPPTVVDPAGAGLAGAVGVIVAVLLIRLDEIVELFAPTGLGGRAQVRS